jgi:hypothetical protein
LICYISRYYHRFLPHHKLVHYIQHPYNITRRLRKSRPFTDAGLLKCHKVGKHTDGDGVISAITRLQMTRQPRLSTFTIDFHERIEQVDNLTIPQLRALIRCCEQNVEVQHLLLSRAMRRLLNGKEPHRQQVRALRRLVYGLGDTIQVVKTGFGESIVFHAYSVLIQFSLFR